MFIAIIQEVRAAPWIKEPHLIFVVDASAKMRVTVSSQNNIALVSVLLFATAPHWRKSQDR
jgi:hypothetical protein